ncbi:hypothetical protein COO72_02565 [Bifidobacterium callitrichos]|nr:hypothetical protein COO72_02565 [Bifidobacterium callitrichos]
MMHTASTTLTELALTILTQNIHPSKAGMILPDFRPSILSIALIVIWIVFALTALRSVGHPRDTFCARIPMWSFLLQGTAGFGVDLSRAYRSAARVLHDQTAMTIAWWATVICMILFAIALLRLVVWIIMLIRNRHEWDRRRAWKTRHGRLVDTERLYGIQHLSTFDGKDPFVEGDGRRQVCWRYGERLVQGIITIHGKSVRLYGPDGYPLQTVDPEQA